jgi:HD-GYP domain-containing protein (c-di-GMP phosphodiesterase class II)
LIAGAGTQFDAEIVHAFLGALDRQASGDAHVATATK